MKASRCLAGKRTNLKAVLALARSRADVVSSIFSPQPAFRLQKLLFVLFPARHRLAFNQDLNCYYLKGRHGRRGQPSVWGTLLRVLLTRSRRGGRTTLFFPTDEDSKAAEAIGRLHDPKVVSPQPIWVFCREDKRSFYQALPGVEEVRTYAPGRDLGKPEGGSGPGPLPSRRCLLDLLSSTRPGA